jgi:hypothetical protein
MDLGLKIEFCVMAWFGFESLEDLGIRVVGKLSKDYYLVFKF